MDTLYKAVNLTLLVSQEDETILNEMYEKVKQYVEKTARDMGETIPMDPRMDDNKAAKLFLCFTLMCNSEIGPWYKEQVKKNPKCIKWMNKRIHQELNGNGCHIHNYNIVLIVNEIVTRILTFYKDE